MMRIRRISTAPKDADALKLWCWLEWMGSEYFNLDEIDDFVTTLFDSIAPPILVNLNSMIADWIEMHVIEIDTEEL